MKNDRPVTHRDLDRMPELPRTAQNPSKSRKRRVEADSEGNGKSKMKLTIANRLYAWDPLTWFSQLFLYGKFKRATLSKTEHWHRVLSMFIEDVPEEMPVRLYNNLQELRREIGHYRIDLMQNKMKRLGHDFEK